MTELTPEKIVELTALVAKAPPETAVRLVMMFERAKVKGSQIIPSQDVLSAIRGAGLAAKLGAAKAIPRLPTFERLFFEPFESLFEDGTSQQVLPGNLPRTGLRDVWTVIAKHLAKAEVQAAEPEGTQAILAGNMAHARHLTQRLRDEVLAILTHMETTRLASFGKNGEVQSTLVRLPALFLAEKHGRHIWPDAFGARGALSDAGVAMLGDKVRALEEDNEHAAVELLLLTMADMARPNEIMRVLNKVSMNVDDHKLDITEFAVIGRRLIAIAQRLGLEIEAAALTGQFDGHTLACIIDRFNQTLHGLERDTHLAVDGPWRRAVIGLRSKTGACLTRMCQRSVDELAAALPTRRNQSQALAWSQRLKLDVAIDEGLLERATQYLTLVTDARLFAPLAGFGAPRDDAAKQAQTYLDQIQEALVHTAKQPQRPPHFDGWHRATGQLIGATDGRAAADLFERRITANLAAVQASAA